MRCTCWLIPLVYSLPPGVACATLVNSSIACGVCYCHPIYLREHPTTLVPFTARCLCDFLVYSFNKQQKLLTHFWIDISTFGSLKFSRSHLINIHAKLGPENKVRGSTALSFLRLTSVLQCFDKQEVLKALNDSKTTISSLSNTCVKSVRCSILDPTHLIDWLIYSIKAGM